MPDTYTIEVLGSYSFENAEGSPHIVRGLAMLGTDAVVCSPWGELTALDCRHPDNIQQIGHVSLDHYCESVVFSQKPSAPLKLFVMAGGRIFILGYPSMEVVGELRYRLPNGADGMFGIAQDRRGRVYVAHGGGKLLVGNLVRGRG